MTTLQQVADGQTYPEVPINENFETVSCAALFGKRHAVTSGLTWGYYGGFYASTSVADGTVTLTNTATNYVVVARSTGVVSVATSTTNWNNTATYGRLYKLTVAGGVVTAEEDHRFGSTGILATPGAIAASSVSVADAGGYFTATDSEAVLQEIGAALGGASALPVTTYTADLSSTSDADPGAGKLRFNNATPTSSTQLFIDDETSDGVDLSTYFASLGSSGFIKVMAAADEWQLWKWTATPTDGTGYWKFTVTLQASKGTVDDTDALKVLFDNGGAASGGTAGKHAIYIAAGSMRPSVTGGCAALAAVASASNQPDIVTLDFDATTQEYAQFGVVMPKSWNEATITFRAHWSHAATTTNFGVVWDLQAVAVSDDDAIAVAYGTAQTSTDTGGTTNDLYTSPESSAITVAGTPAAEDMVFFRLSRVTGNESDTMAIDARLHGITLYITTDAETDA